MGGESTNETINGDVCFEVLKILESFSSGTMTERDLEYVTFQKQNDTSEDYPLPELAISWVHYLLFNFHNIKINYSDFKNRFIIPLLKEKLIRVPRADHIDNLIQDTRSIDVFEFTVEITPEGVLLYKKLKVLKDKTRKVLRFDDSTGHLYVDDMPLGIRKWSKHFNIFKAIFDDKDMIHREIFFDELKDKIDASDIKLNNKYFLNAFQALQRKLKEIGVNDLFTLTNQSVRFNSKYLT